VHPSPSASFSKAFQGGGLKHGHADALTRGISRRERSVVSPQVRQKNPARNIRRSPEALLEIVPRVLRIYICRELLLGFRRKRILLRKRLG